MLSAIRRLWEHLQWADDLLLAALSASAAPPPEAVREYAHILGADEVWLSRLTGRKSQLPVWPDLDTAQLSAAARDIRRGFADYLARLDAAELVRPVRYTNSAGQSFETPVQEILLHVALHAQYHRGKVNLLLRGAGLPPVPTDYIAYIRGVPAAITPPAAG